MLNGLDASCQADARCPICSLTRMPKDGWPKVGRPSAALSERRVALEPKERSCRGTFHKEQFFERKYQPGRQRLQSMHLQRMRACVFWYRGSGSRKLHLQQLSLA